jgi:hypothetical protein
MSQMLRFCDDFSFPFPIQLLLSLGLARVAFLSVNETVELKEERESCKCGTFPSSTKLKLQKYASIQGDKTPLRSLVLSSAPSDDQFQPFNGSDCLMQCLKFKLC